MGLWGALEGIIKSAGDSIDKIFTSDEERLEARNVLEKIIYDTKKLVSDYDLKFADMQTKILTSENQFGTDWQKNVRPTFAYLCIFLIFNNYILSPYVNTYTPWVYPVVIIPDKLWDLITLCMSFYYLSRGYEKGEWIKKVQGK